MNNYLQSYFLAVQAIVSSLAVVHGDFFFALPMILVSSLLTGALWSWSQETEEPSHPIINTHRNEVRK